MNGQRMRQMREALGYTQEYVSEQIGVAPLQINRYENNKTLPNGEIVAKIAQALHTSTDYLLGLTDNPNPVWLASVDLTPQERAVISLWRKGERIEAVRIIASVE